MSEPQKKTEPKTLADLVREHGTVEEALAATWEARRAAIREARASEPQKVYRLDVPKFDATELTDLPSNKGGDTGGSFIVLTHAKYFGAETFTMDELCTKIDQAPKGERRAYDTACYWFRRLVKAGLFIEA